MVVDFALVLLFGSEELVLVADHLQLDLGLPELRLRVDVMLDEMLVFGSVYLSMLVETAQDVLVLFQLPPVHLDLVEVVHLFLYFVQSVTTF